MLKIRVTDPQLRKLLSSSIRASRSVARMYHVGDERRTIAEAMLFGKIIAFELIQDEIGESLRGPHYTSRYSV